MSDAEIVEMRHPVRSSDADREEASRPSTTGVADSGIARRPLIRNSLLGALGRPRPAGDRHAARPRSAAGRRLAHTVWPKGMRRRQRRRRHPDQARGGRDRPAHQRASPAIFYEDDAEGEPTPTGHRAPAGRRPRPPSSWSGCSPTTSPRAGDARTGASTGILCYSKICTHVGCPISLWEQQTHHLLCPCHQSTFDLADNGKVIFGPAARPLPQLPLMVDSEGYLVATSDFTEPVGPSFWERG